MAVITTVKYGTRPGSRVAAEDAQPVGEELQQIRVRDGQVTPRAVLTEARDSASILHGYFDWNDATAAETHRLEQARRLIRSIRIVREENDDEGNVPAFCSITVATNTEEGEEEASEPQRYYLCNEEVMDDEELRLRHLQDLVRRVCGYRDQLAQHPEAKQSGFLKALDKLERLVDSEMKCRLELA